MTKAKLIRKKESIIVDLKTKVILKYTSEDKKREINHMKISGRNPENADFFIYETEVDFMVYVIKGSGKIYCDDQVFEVGEGDVIDVPKKVKFAAEGKNLEYITAEYPAWFKEQAFIVDKKGNVVENTEK
jgi:mannose-6-phosphate isomerase-like protein (cupin superfamily)